jgi:hypothetical protein
MEFPVSVPSPAAPKLAATAAAVPPLEPNDRACFAQLADHEGVTRRDRALERERAGGRRHVGGVVVVLDDHRHAVERPDDALARKARVELVGAGQRLGVHQDDRVKRGALLVVGLDPVEIRLHEPPAAELLGPDGSLDVGNGRFLREQQSERTRRGREREEERQKCDDGCTARANRLPIHLAFPMSCEGP